MLGYKMVVLQLQPAAEAGIDTHVLWSKEVVGYELDTSEQHIGTTLRPRSTARRAWRHLAPHNVVPCVNRRHRLQ